VAAVVAADRFQGRSQDVDGSWVARQRLASGPEVSQAFIGPARAHQDGTEVALSLAVHWVGLDGLARRL
jgi:hypothetical protein